MSPEAQQLVKEYEEQLKNKRKIDDEVYAKMMGKRYKEAEWARSIK